MRSKYKISRCRYLLHKGSNTRVLMYLQKSPRTEIFAKTSNNKYNANRNLISVESLNTQGAKRIVKANIIYNKPSRLKMMVCSFG